MPIERVAGTNLTYYFAAFDADSRERPDDPDGPMSDQIVAAAADPSITDIFIFAHGWRHSLLEAQHQYGDWIRLMAGQTADMHQMHAVRPGFHPLLVGLHWPSEPGFAALRGLSVQDQHFTLRDRVIATFGDLFGKETRTTDALAAIAAGVEQAPTDLTLSSAEQAGYAELAKDAELVEEQEAGPREESPPLLDPAFIIKRVAGDARHAHETGFLSKLAPLAMLSFWKMKRRARIFGGSAGPPSPCAYITAGKLECACASDGTQLWLYCCLRDAHRLPRFDCASATATGAVADPRAGCPLSVVVL